MLGEKADRSSFLTVLFVLRVRHATPFRLMYLPIQAFEALAASYEFRFGDCLCRFVIHGLDLSPRHGSQAVAIRSL
jgi:hypothetical protein